VIAGGNGGGCNTNQLYNTVGVALDSSRQLYVADSACSQLVRFPASSNSTTFGVLIASLSTPEGIFIDPSTDDLYVAVYGDNSVVKFANGSTTPVVVAGV
jgi:DNA-binding beta-propeller fold protein YncE